MKNKLALAACTLLTVGSVMAAETSDNNPPPAQSTPSDFHFGSGLTLGEGGGGSASSFSGGFASPAGNSGSGGFGAGFTAGPGSGMLSPPAAGVGGAGGAGGVPLSLFR